MTPEPASALPAREILRLWWPLAASWMLMGLELPLISAAMARLPDAEVNLAAHGGIVFPVALAIESPIMMLLAASTALAKDEQAAALIRRFMIRAALVLTALHALLAFTPLFDFVASRLLGAPAQTHGPARLGLALMLPWTASIAWRRFHQGLLIRRGRSRPVAVGTLVRLVAGVGVLVAGTAWGAWPGIAVGAAGLSAGVLAEAAFITWCARDVRPPRPEPDAVPLTTRAFLHFYVPLALTQVLSLSIPPLTAAAVSRMPLALASLAAWPAATGISFLLRGPAFAFHEVVVSLLARPGALRPLARFARGVALVSASACVLLGATPLGDAWFAGVLGLPPHVARLARLALLVGALLPAIAAFEHWWQGRLVHAHRTRSVTVGTFLYLATTALLLALSVGVAPWPGILTATAAVTLAGGVKAAWLWSRARRLSAP